MRWGSGEMSQRILIIDDDELVRSGLAANLEGDGFKVSTAENGENGLAILGRETFDLVICDLLLGDLDGIEVLHRIKQQWPMVAVVMITGHATIRNALDALRGGASDYIAKPADPDEVAHRVRTVLDTEHLRRALDAERASADARQRETRDALGRAERMSSLGILAGGTADDLSNILLPIVEHASALQAMLGAEHPGQGMAESIAEASRRAAAVLEDLKAIGTSIEYAKERVNLNALVEEYLKSDECARLKAAFPGIRFETRFGDSLPAVTGSTHALSRSVGHLLTFICESMKGGGTLKIETHAQRLERAVGRYGVAAPGNYVALTIADHAPALSEEDLERLFEPFYNRTVMGRQLSSGLGMTLVHRVVTDHGGLIDLNAPAEGGNLYQVFLPAERSAEDSVVSSPDYSGRECVLLVDDSDAQREAASEMLRDLGYRVLTAANGREAVRLFEAVLRQPDQQIDLALIDLILGDDFDGVDVFKRMAELNPGQPAVLASGFADMFRISEGRKIGIRQVIAKPYSVETLGAALRSALNR